MTEIFEALDGLLPQLEDIYRDLHAHPELAFQEERTAAVVTRYLADIGWEVASGIGSTGVVGVLRNGDGPAVMLRADMDALPVREETGLPYASTVTATDATGAQVPVSHACGHDLHVTALLGACALLSRHRDGWRGVVIAVFQPGEESGFGARAMVDDGLFDRFPIPDVVLGQHIGPGPAGLVATCPGTAMGSTDSITVHLFGRGGHGSKPDSAVDPVVMAASLVLRLQTVVSRSIPPSEQAVITVGKLQAGTTAAVIPDRAELGINVRSFSPRVRETLIGAIERLAQAEATAAEAPAMPAITHVYHLPATVNDPEATERVAKAHRKFFGTVVTIPPLSASEDFGILATAAKAPSVYWFVGATDPGTYGTAFIAGRVEQDIPQNHAANFAPALQPTLTTAIQALITAGLDWLAVQSPDSAIEVSNARKENHGS